jgi:hypothetical protein
MANDPIQDDELTPDLSGDLGTSSERTGPDGRTSGAAATHPGEDIPEVHPVEPGVPAGELDENPAEVPSHASDPARNAGHSHG